MLSVADFVARAVCARPKLVAAALGVSLLAHVVDVRFHGSIIGAWVKWRIRRRLRGRPHPRDVQGFLLGETTLAIPSAVTAFDLDTYGHMNNSRYLAACDVARVHGLSSIGFFDACHAERTAPVVASLGVRFRVELPPLRRYTVRLRCAGYDAVSLFLEHSFVTKGRKGEDILHAVVALRYQLTRKATLAPVLRRLGLVVGEESFAGFDDAAGVAVSIPLVRPPPDDVAQLLDGVTAVTERCKSQEYLGTSSVTVST